MALVSCEECGGTGKGTVRYSRETCLACGGTGVRFEFEPDPVKLPATNGMTHGDYVYQPDETYLDQWARDARRETLARRVQG